ncbi:MAG: hypothetical protein RBT74_15785 [Tenuifilaceae bacterium]|jgi:hypothetical protein|nr:hypothetical protein [Tenuifilaceae bacterium]
MAKTTFSNEMASILIKHQAVCLTCTYRGKWRNNPNEAYEDAEKHREKSGNERHILDVLTQQTTRLRIFSNQ